MLQDPWLNQIKIDTTAPHGNNYNQAFSSRRCGAITQHIVGHCLSVGHREREDVT
jgi:hypothetical protein